MAELLQLPVSWRIIEICQAATDTPFNENSRSSQFNVTQGFRLLTKFGVHLNKSLGGVR